MATPDHKRDLISELLRIPQSSSSNYQVPVRNILLDIPGTTRAELLAVVGTEAKPLSIAGWRISYDEERDFVCFMRDKPSPPQPAVARVGSVPPPVTRPTPVPMNPVTVGAQAQEYQRQERAKGREISATEAVRHIMAQNNC